MRDAVIGDTDTSSGSQTMQTSFMGSHPECRVEFKSVTLIR